MIRISHRANLKGPNPEFENSPQAIRVALSLGFHVEVDLRYLDGKFYLGHDTPDYEVDWDFLNNEKFFVHCKDLASLTFLATKTLTTFKADFFAHESDPWVLTDKGYIWTMPGSEVKNGSIIVDCENKGVYGRISGICSDCWL